MTEHLANDGVPREPVRMSAGIRPHPAVQRADDIASARVGVDFEAQISTKHSPAP